MCQERSPQHRKHRCLKWPRYCSSLPWDEGIIRVSPCVCAPGMCARVLPVSQMLHTLCVQGNTSHIVYISLVNDWSESPQESYTSLALSFFLSPSIYLSFSHSSSHNLSLNHSLLLSLSLPLPPLVSRERSPEAVSLWSPSLLKWQSALITMQGMSGTIILPLFFSVFLLAFLFLCETNHLAYPLQISMCWNGPNPLN